jgi:hypothetical protein
LVIANRTVAGRKHRPPRRTGVFLLVVIVLQARVLKQRGKRRVAAA